MSEPEELSEAEAKLVADTVDRIREMDKQLEPFYVAMAARRAAHQRPIRRRLYRWIGRKLRLM